MSSSRQLASLLVLAVVISGGCDLPSVSDTERIAAPNSASVKVDKFGTLFIETLRGHRFFPPWDFYELRVDPTASVGNTDRLVSGLREASRFLEQREITLSEFVDNILFSTYSSRWEGMFARIGASVALHGPPAYHNPGTSAASVAKVNALNTLLSVYIGWDFRARDDSRSAYFRFLDAELRELADELENVPAFALEAAELRQLLAAPFGPSNPSGTSNPTADPAVSLSTIQHVLERVHLSMSEYATLHSGKSPTLGQTQGFITPTTFVPMRSAPGALRSSSSQKGTTAKNNGVTVSVQDFGSLIPTVLAWDETSGPTFGFTTLNGQLSEMKSLSSAPTKRAAEYAAERLIYVTFDHENIPDVVARFSFVVE